MGEGSLFLFDLLSNRQREIQQAIESKWNDENDIQLTNSEWVILNRINYGRELLADVCKNNEFTRQGTHKLIQKLEERGLVQTEKLDNKRNKYVELTQLGITCYEEGKALMKTMDEHIKCTLGTETYDELRMVLETDWELSVSSVEFQKR